MKVYYKGTAEQALACMNERMRRHEDDLREASKYENALEALRDLTGWLEEIERRLERGDRRGINDAHSDLAYACSAFESFRLKLEDEWDELNNITED